MGKKIATSSLRTPLLASYIPTLWTASSIGLRADILISTTISAIYIQKEYKH